MNEVRMLGALEVRVPGARLGPRDFGAVKPKQLLEILLLERGRLVTKDRIADLLWPAERPRRPGPTIETYVSLLRRRLGAGAIVTEPGGLSPPRRALQRRRRSLRGAAAPGGGRARRGAPAGVRRGGGARRGGPARGRAVRGLVVPTRAHYRERQLQALVDLAECCLELDDYEGALAVASEALAREPTCERACRALMAAHHAAEDRAAALRAYERCRAALAEELGVPPSPETARLHLAILREEAPAAPAPRPILYATNGSVRIAYQLVGDGPLDIVFSPSHVSNLAANWDEPTYAAFLGRLRRWAG